MNRVVARSGTSFLWGMRALSAERRRAIYAIYAFCREVDDIADEPGENADKRRALSAWRQEVDRLYAGEPSWPTTRALLKPVRCYNLPREEFLAVIEGMEIDARPTVRMRNLDDLLHYCRKVARSRRQAVHPCIRRPARPRIQDCRDAGKRSAVDEYPS